jgi:hypothetical protein
MDEDDRRERLARNEALFRRVNEAIEAGRQDTDDRSRVAFLCECGALGCNELIELAVGDYEAVREHPRRFFLVPGHEAPEVEDVVGHGEGFTVVEKHADQAETAEASFTPRS